LVVAARVADREGLMAVGEGWVALVDWAAARGESCSVQY